MAEQDRGGEPTAAEVTKLLDGIDGAWEAAAEGVEQASRGEGVPLDELGDEASG
jgi:hypothetical protein